MSSPPRAPIRGAREDGFIGDMWLDAMGLGGIETASVSSSNEDYDDLREEELSLDQERYPGARSRRNRPRRHPRSDTLESLDDIPSRPQCLGSPTGYEGIRTIEQFQNKFREQAPEDTSRKSQGLVRSMSQDLSKSFLHWGHHGKQHIRSIQMQARGSGVAATLKGFGYGLLEKLPLLDTVRTYKKEYLGPDLGGGLAEGIMSIPMGMSYALLANIPAVYGLYTGFMPPLIYLILGTCHQLSLGVSAIESLLVAEGVAGVIGWVGDSVNEATTQADIDAKVQLTIAFTMAVGLWHLVMRILGIGLVATLLADPVLSGFSTASAFLIVTSQLKNLTGVNLYSGSIVPFTWIDTIKSIPKFNVTAITMGSLGILGLWLMRKANRRWLPQAPLPIQLLVVIVATAATYLLGLDKEPFNLEVLGVVPAGLPRPTMPTIPMVNGMRMSDIIGPLIIQSLIVAVMTYIITISIGKVMGNKNSFKVDPNQELVAMGTANVVGSMMLCYAASGSLSRTSVVDSVGTKTRMHAILSVFIIVLTLLLITPLLYYLPKAILASVVVFGVVRMFDFGEAKRLYHLHKPDFLLWNISFWVTFMAGAIIGIAVSVVSSLIWLLMKSSRPYCAILGRLPGTDVYRNVKRFAMAKELPGVRIMRFDASLHFANKDYFQERLKLLELPSGGNLGPATPRRQEAWVPIHTIIVDASAINDLDASAIRMLIEVAAAYNERKVTLCFANWKGPQRDLLDISGFYEQCPRENIFLSLHDAVVDAKRMSKKRCRDHSGEEQRLTASITALDEVTQAPPETIVEVNEAGVAKIWRVPTSDDNTAKSEGTSVNDTFVRDEESQQMVIIDDSDSSRDHIPSMQQEHRERAREHSFSKASLPVSDIAWS
ncbi:unnamed protein product [Chrysoparadoxa australica]